ncbi:MAG: ATP-binding protein [Candidatus Nitrosocaldus sp.]|nr:ATP-binding protein [Candidatus Nitrosocaldus sp.]MDW8000602.1 AAA family ATPase [Candidatus Nitrosocaldus sp.]
MLKDIRIKNFKCLEDVEIETRPLTVLIGPNGSGKSSIIQALLLLKRFVTQSSVFSLDNIGDFTSIDYLNLGRYEELVYRHLPDKRIEVGIDVVHDGAVASYSVAFGRDQCMARLDSSVPKINLGVNFTLPYPLNSTINTSIDIDGRGYNLVWNGVLLTIQPPVPQEERLPDLNPHIPLLRGTYLISPRSLFRSWAYGYGIPIDPNRIALTDHELISIMVNESDVDEKVATWCRRIMEVEVLTRLGPGNMMKVESRYQRLRVPLALDGTGINRLAYILAMLAYREARLLLVEEPEIHLHPSRLFALGQQLLPIIKEEGKQVIVTTHDEHMIIGMLTSIAEGSSTREDVAIYYMQKDGLDARAKRLEINENGQVEGGLPGFFEANWDITERYLKALAGVEKGR